MILAPMILFVSSPLLSNPIPILGHTVRRFSRILSIHRPAVKFAILVSLASLTHSGTAFLYLEDTVFT